MRVSLFWRTFLMIGALIVVSVLAALQLVRVFDRSPPDQQLAWEIASVVNLTRTALINSQGERRTALLSELAREERVRVVPLEPSDRIEPLTSAVPGEGDLGQAVEAKLKSLLGRTTQLAGRVNGDEGLWVSFDIDGDGYWLELSRERFDRQSGPNWLLIGLITLALSVLGAIAISQLVNRPLARLAAAIERLSQGESPERLPENVPTEIAEVNRRFNRMATDLAELESDRAVALAGISHDIRSPLARLRLEIELSGMTESDKVSMGEDIERIDRIVGQFLEYGRAGQSEPGGKAEEIDVSQVIGGIEASYRTRLANQELRLEVQMTPGIRWRGDPLDLTRILLNLTENSLRYGRTAGACDIRVQLLVTRERHALLIEFSDQGPGVPADQYERLLRPFSRLDPERSSKGGAGLGLAIVARIAQRYDGDCRLGPAPGGGLRVNVKLRDAPGSAPGRS